MSPPQINQPHTIIVSTGTRPLPQLPAGRLIAADGGLARCVAAGLRPDLVVGDFDSIDADVLAAYTANGGTIARHPVDKNETDLELALSHARPGDHLVVVGGDGLDRPDHAFGEIAFLGQRTTGYASVTVHYPPAILRVVRAGETVTCSGEVGSIVSLVPMFGKVDGVTVSGVRWPLRSATFAPGTTWGMSNELTESTVEVSISAGTLLVIQPTFSETELP
jgi:thiamine pyrophosphokinase